MKRPIIGQLQKVFVVYGYQLEDPYQALADVEPCAWIARTIL